MDQGNQPDSVSFLEVIAQHKKEHDEQSANAAGLIQRAALESIVKGFDPEEVATICGFDIAGQQVDINDLGVEDVGNGIVAVNDIESFVARMLGMPLGLMRFKAYLHEAIDKIIDEAQA